jgi:hypothetical protein
MMSEKRSRTKEQEQSRRFVEAARALGADQSEQAFDDALRRIAKAPVRSERRERDEPDKAPTKGKG